MGMFSTKPPFNLADFLAQKAPAGRSRNRYPSAAAKRPAAATGSEATPAKADPKAAKKAPPAPSE